MRTRVVKLDPGTPTGFRQNGVSIRHCRESNGVDAFTLGFDLADAVQFRFSLDDEFGTTYDDQRLFAIDARAAEGR